MTQKNPTSLAAARDLLIQYKNATSSVAHQRNLDLLWTTLESMRAAGAVKFTLAEIGERLASLGGPKTQTIRNPTGIKFREIINLYKLALQTPHQEADPSEVERALATMTNAGAKHTLRQFIEKTKATADDRDKLKIAIKEMSLKSSPERPVEALHSNSQSVPSWIFEAIAFNLDPIRLMEKGYSFSDQGSVQDGNEISMLGADFISAMDHLLTLYGKPPLPQRLQ
jgi:hypothetical protein